MYTEGLSPQVQNDIEDAPVGVGGIGRRKRSRGDEGWMTDVAKQIEKDEKSYANETRKPATASNATLNSRDSAFLDAAYKEAMVSIKSRFRWINDNEQQNEDKNPYAKFNLALQYEISKAVAYLVQLKIDQKLNRTDYKVLSKAVTNPDTQHLAMTCIIESFLADDGFDFEAFKDLLSN